MLHGAKLEHALIKPRVKKIAKIKFCISIISENGYYDLSAENYESLKKFFSFFNHTYIVTGGIDMTTGKENIIPFFKYSTKFSPRRNFNAGLFSTLEYFDAMFQTNILEGTVGRLQDYNYLERDILQDYLFIPALKSVALYTIRQYCYLFYILNFIITVTLSDEMNEIYFFERYLMLYQILRRGTFPSKKMENVILKSKIIFENETDIYRLLIFKSAPRIIGVENPSDFYKIFNYYSVDELKNKIREIYLRKNGDIQC